VREDRDERRDGREEGEDRSDKRGYALAAFGLLCAMGLVAYAHVTGVERYARSPATGVRLNVNTASADTLALLPQVGPEKANAIIAHRERYGPFRDYRELIAVEGIGAKTVGAIVGYICFEDEPPR
jgi:competence ComEA-like helix-hairpin-helix protein